jgi:hypothetical protein
VLLICYYSRMAPRSLPAAWGCRSGGCSTMWSLSRHVCPVCVRHESSCVSRPPFGLLWLAGAFMVLSGASAPRYQLFLAPSVELKKILVSSWLPPSPRPGSAPTLPGDTALPCRSGNVAPLLVDATPVPDVGYARRSLCRIFPLSFLAHMRNGWMSLQAVASICAVVWGGCLVWQNFWRNATVAVSLLFGKYCPIMV